jgi:hypothetical protein
MGCKRVAREVWAVALIPLGLIAGPTREVQGAATVFEGEAVISETNVPNTAIGDPVEFTLLLDLRLDDPGGDRHLTVYSNRPGNALLLTSRSAVTASVSHQIGCGMVDAFVYDDHETEDDAIRIVGTACSDLYTPEPVAGAGFTLRDRSRRALGVPLFPDTLFSDPRVLASFGDERHLIVGYTFPTAFEADLAPLPEPGSGAAVTALVTVALIRGAERRMRPRRRSP